MAKEGLNSSLFSIRELSERIKSGDISPIDLVGICLNRIKILNPRLNAFITVIDEQQLHKQAQLAEKEIKQGKYRSPLHGIPFSIKDIFHVKGVRCTAGSKILANYVPSTEATVIKKMSKAGAIFIGTNNLNEFASGITGINPFYGTSKNPWDISKMSGGSSGGSAVAVATGMVHMSLGTDTGGSIRVPSSLCGIVGLKPTYGRFSKQGYFPLSPSLDHVGSLTRSVWDAAAIMEYIAGGYPSDNTLENSEVPAYTKIIEKSNLDGIRIGLPKEYFLNCLHPAVEHLYYDFIEALRSMGSISV
jgi:aspartyl-tRNA(Asn)/glutamyl-tRNA(Gln) amidotransferase subunit A